MKGDSDACVTEEEIGKKDEEKLDKDVMELEFKKYKGKESKRKGMVGDGKYAKPVNQRGKVTKEQMLTAPHSPYFEVRVGQAVFLRQAANDEFAANNIEEAIKLYERALYHCDFSDSKINFEQSEEQKQSLQDATDPVYLNLARCYLKRKEYNKAITNARASIHSKSSELSKTKARYLEGKALYHLNDFDGALKVLDLGAVEINDETERKENTNLLQQSLLQADYQHLIRLVKEGKCRHKAHDIKVWGGLLKGNDDVAKEGWIQVILSGNSWPIILVGVILLAIAVYKGGQKVG